MSRSILIREMFVSRFEYQSPKSKPVIKPPKLTINIIKMSCLMVGPHQTAHHIATQFPLISVYFETACPAPLPARTDNRAVGQHSAKHYRNYD